MQNRLKLDVQDDTKVQSKFSNPSRYKSWDTPSFSEWCVHKLWSFGHSRNYIICRCARGSNPRLSCLEQSNFAHAAFTRGPISANSCSPGAAHALKSRADIRIPDPQTLFAFRVRCPFCARLHSPRADFFPLERRNTSHFTRPLKDG
jgi:hypothetical protein